MKKTVVFMTILTMLLISCGKKGANSQEKKSIDKKVTTKVTAKQKLPKDFPTDIFIIKGTIKHSTIIKKGDKKTVSIYISEELSAKETREKIVKEMEANGWTTKMNVATQLYFSKGDKILKVGISKGDKETELSYMATY